MTKQKLIIEIKNRLKYVYRDYKGSNGFKNGARLAYENCLEKIKKLSDCSQGGMGILNWIDSLNLKDAEFYKTELEKRVTKLKDLEKHNSLEIALLEGDCDNCDKDPV